MHNINLTPQEIDIIDLPNEELRWSVVKLSEIVERENRLEASVFDIEGKHAREVLGRCKWELTTICGSNGLATAYHRPRFKRIWVEKSQYPIYQPSQITDIFPKPYAYISDKTNTDIDGLRVKFGQILLTCSGTIGNTTVVTRTLENKIFSHDLIRINPYNDLDIGYIYAFLKTKVGNTLVNTNSYGAVISHIEPEHLATVPIPNASPIIKAEINRLIMDSFRLRDESNELLVKAESILVDELKLPPLEEMEQERFDKSVEFRNFSVKLSELDNRLEASYHLPLVKSIIKYLQTNSKEVTTISDKRISKKIILPGRFKRVYVEEGQGTVFFGGKQIFELDPSNKKYLSLKHHSKRIKDELSLKENMIMVTCSGTIGKTVLVPKHWENWTANQHIIRIIPASEDIAGYLFVFLASDYGYQLITRFTYGAVVDEIDDVNHISNVQIPLLLNHERQLEINSLALEANRKRFEAYKLEQKAIKIMNEDVIHAEK